MLKKLTVGFIAAALVIAACKDDEQRPPVSAGGGGTTSAAGGSTPASDAGLVPTDAGTDAGICNDLVNSTKIVAETAENGDAPTGTGGAITDGTYDLTNATVFVSASGVPGDTGNTYTSSIRISGGKFDRLLHVVTAGNATNDTSASGTFTASTNNATIVLSCPSAAQEQVTYTTNGNDLILNSPAAKTSLAYALRQ